MGKNPIVAVIAAIIIVVAIILMFRSGGSTAPPPEGAPWYDLGTSKLYGEPDAAAVPPGTAPSGKEGVRAYVFSCTSCTDKASRFVSYLEKYTPEAKAEYEKVRWSEDMPARHAAMLNTVVRGVEDADWVERDSGEGEKIMVAAGDQCAPSPATKCGTHLE